MSGWQILMMTSGKKLDSSVWIGAGNATNRAKFAACGTLSFSSASLETTEATERTDFGDGVGVYNAFFTQTNITKIALVDGSSLDKDPTTHTNYLIYDLVESTDEESIYDILLRLDQYQSTASHFHGNDGVWGDPSVLNHTAGTNGYSGLLSDSDGTGFITNNAGLPTPDKFCIMGINRDSDNDIQALCAFSGNLQSGKGDSWRGVSPAQTFWSYWGHDFHSNSQVQRIGNSLQTAPGVVNSNSPNTWNNDVYLMGFGDNESEEQTITVEGIESEEAVSSPNIMLVIRSNSISSTENVSSPNIMLLITSNSISSAESVSSPQIHLKTRQTGIPSSENFGNPRVKRCIPVMGLYVCRNNPKRFCKQANGAMIPAITVLNERLYRLTSYKTIPRTGRFYIDLS